MQLVIIKVYKKRFYIIIIICLPIHIGGSLYSTGKFSNSSDVLLVTDISCSQSDTSISQCTISHYTKTSYCDVKDIAAVRCHSKLKHEFLHPSWWVKPPSWGVLRSHVCIYANHYD